MKIPLIISVFALMGGVSYLAVTTVTQNTAPEVPAITVADMDALKAEFAAERTTLTEQAAALTAQIDEIDVTRAALADENGTLAARLAELEDGGAAQVTALESAVAERDDLTLELEQTVARLTEIEAENAALVVEKDTLSETVASVQADLAALQESGGSSAAEIETLTAQIEAGREDVQSLQASLSEVEGERDALTARVAEVEGERDALTARVAELEAAGSDVSDGGSDEIATLTNLVDGQTADLAVAQDRIAELEAQATAFEGEVAGLTQALAERDEALAALQAPPPLEVCQERTDAVLAESQIDFDNGTTALASTTVPLLEELAVIATECVEKGLTLDIEGHTDSDGGQASNLLLSNGRAQTVHDFFVEQGLPEAALRPIGFGEADPIADNETSEGRARNRRVVLDWE